MRVLFLTHYYPPEVGAPQARISALAAALGAHGVDVAVHTTFPHYPDGVVAAPYRNRPFARELRDGVPVVRSAVYPAANAGVARRLANHLSFAASALATAPLAPPADVVVAETPPLFLAAAAVPYAALKRAALVLNVADRWPASAVELGALRQPAAIRAAEALERACYRAADAIAVPTAGLTEALGALPAARRKVHHLPPAVDLERFAVAAERPTSGPLRVVYVGTLGLAQGVGTLVEAARLAGPDVVEVTIAGDGAERAEVARRAAAAGSHVRLLGRLPHAEVPALLAGADLAAVLLRDRPLFEGALPTKMLEAMAAGTPLLLSGRGEAAALVRESGGGVCVEPEDPVALARALRELAADRPALRRMGEAARACARERFGRGAQVARWLVVLEQAALSRRARRRRAS